VMRTTAIPANASDNLEFSFLPKYSSSRYYVYMYFAEIQKLQANQIRQFNIFVNGKLLNSDPAVNPVYLQNLYYLSVISETKLELWLNKTSRSTLPPLLNAVEIYMAKDFLQSETYQTDGMYYLVRYTDFTLKCLSTINSRPCTSLFTCIIILIILLFTGICLVIILSDLVLFMIINSWCYPKCEVNLWDQEKLARRSLYSSLLLMEWPKLQLCWYGFTKDHILVSYVAWNEKHTPMIIL